MNFDFEKYLHTVNRKVKSLEYKGKPAKAVILKRIYATTIDDLWDALTTKERIERWFLPISGDLKLNGRYKFEGNAEGEIKTCAKPNLLEITWEFGGFPSWVKLELHPERPKKVSLTLTHIVHLSDHWMQYGAGATGIGWELGMVGLDLHIINPDEKRIDEQAFAMSKEGKEFMITSSEQWGQAAIAAGENEKESLDAVKRTTAFYTGEQ